MNSGNQYQIDTKNEVILQKIIKIYGNYDLFFKETEDNFIKNEFLFEGFTEQQEIFKTYIANFKKILKTKTFFKNFELNIDNLLEFNELLLNQKGYRDKNIVHRHFLHEPSDYTTIEKDVKKVFNNLKNSKELTVLETYSYLHYHLTSVFPFYYSISIRLFLNIYLMNHDYLPFIPQQYFKSEYYSAFQNQYEKFEDTLFELMIKSLDTLTLYLERKNG